MLGSQHRCWLGPVLHFAETSRAQSLKTHGITRPASPAAATRKRGSGDPAASRRGAVSRCSFAAAPPPSRWCPLGPASPADVPGERRQKRGWAEPWAPAIRLPQPHHRAPRLRPPLQARLFPGSRRRSWPRLRLRRPLGCARAAAAFSSASPARLSSSRR